MFLASKAKGSYELPNMNYLFCLMILFHCIKINWLNCLDKPALLTQHLNSEQHIAFHAFLVLSPLSIKSCCIPREQVPTTLLHSLFG